MVQPDSPAMRAGEDRSSAKIAGSAQDGPAAAGDLQVVCAIGNLQLGVDLGNA